MTRIVRLVIATLAGVVLAAPATATTTTIDYSDLWYNAPAESQAGWGVNVAQQGEILFVTLFVYGPDGLPHWYVGSDVAKTAANAFSGQLFNIASGTYFGNPWAGIGAVQPVGNIAFTFGSATTGVMSYTVNNVQVTKNIVRQTWAGENLGGTYVGAVTGFGASCGPTGRVRIPGALVVTHDTSAQAVTMTLDFSVSPTQTGRCTYHGSYSQVGSMGTIGAGTYSCDVNNVVNAVVGNFTVDEIRATRNGWLGRITVVSPNCDYAGYMGGVKDSF
jgi:hypothetical protein